MTKRRPLAILTLALAVFSFMLFAASHEAGAAMVEKGTFTKITAAGNQTVNLANASLTPKAVIFFWTKNPTNNTYATRSMGGVGFAAYDGAAYGNASVALNCDDAVATHNCGRQRSQTYSIQTLTDGTPTLAARASVTAFGAGSFTLNWQTADAVADIIHYIAIGGSDLTNAKVGTFSLSTATGDQAVTGTGFQPDFVMMLAGLNEAADTATANGLLNLGFATSSTAQGALSLCFRDANVGKYTQQRTDQVLMSLTTTGTQDSLSSFVSMDTNGFTINKSDAPAAAMTVAYLALKGPNFKVGSFNRITTAGNQPVSTVGFQPNGTFFMSRLLAAGTAITSGVSEATIGAADSAATIADGTVWFESSNAATSDANMVSVNNQVMRVATSQTTTTDANFVSNDTNGFTISWSAAWATAAEVLYWAIGPILTVGDGTNPGNSSRCPDGLIADLDSFTLQTSSGTDTVTAAQVDFGAGTEAGVGQVAITSDTGGTTYGTQANPTDPQNVTLSTNITANTTLTQYKVRVTPKIHTAMAAPPGDTYAVTGTVTALTSAYKKIYNDSGSATVTIDNLSPADAVWGTITPGDTQITLNWSNPADADFSEVVILRKVGSAITDAPTEGQTYVQGNTIGLSTVRYVGPLQTFLDTGLTNGQSYYYKIFSKDTCGNYAVGAGTGPHTPVSPNATVISGSTAVAGDAKITVNSPYTGDLNANNYIVVSYRLTGIDPYVSACNFSGNHQPSPYICVISGLTNGQGYDVQIDWFDADGLSGTDPEFFINIVPAAPLLIHNSTNTGSIKWSPNGWGITGGKYGRFVCATCHTPRATQIKGISSAFKTPDGSNWNSVGASNSVNVNFQSISNMGDDTGGHATSTRVCEVCHSITKYHNYDTADNTGGTAHYNTEDCTGCHPHAQAFKAAESAGGSDCGGCHSNVYTPMNNETTTYHHRQSSAAVGYPVANSPADADKRCLMCHADHNIFRADKNPSNTWGRGANLRTDIATAPSTGAPVTAGYTNADFAGSVASGGICISCHYTAQTKNTVNQKSDGTTLTPAIAKTPYNASAHNYNATATYTTDSSAFAANCSKCHNDTSARKYQNSVFNTALHNSPIRRMVSNMGASVSDPLEETVCYRCHARTSDAAATNKPVAGKDWYNVQTMSTASEFIYNAIANTANRHNVANTTWAGRHKPSPSEETRSYISANKHIECEDCHNPHQAKAGRHTKGSGTLANVLTGASGVTVTTWGANWANVTTWGQATGAPLPDATAEWQICFKCHSHANSNYSTWGGTGHSSWTDVALEFNPNNEAYHPVVQALPSSGNRQLAAGALTGGWTPGQVMNCADCHAMDASASGPHGSSVKWLLNPNTTGTKYYNWPYTTTLTSDTGIGATTGFVMSTGSATVPGANFCFSCHVWSGGGQGHTGSAGSHNKACVGCHIRVPHGGKMPRLLTSILAPDRYRPYPAAPNTTIFLDGVNRPASGTMTQTNCNGGGGCADHTGTITFAW